MTKTRIVRSQLTTEEVSRGIVNTLDTSWVNDNMALASVSQVPSLIMLL